MEKDQSTDDSVPSGAFGAAARIKALDRLTAANLRNSQVISKPLDIVRELVENSLDADASTIQVYLEKFGKDKIEVRDNGHGIVSSNVKEIFQGGCTSKLQDTSNLSREKYLGFRGEALNSMCAAGNVTVISKSAKESLATKYKFDFLGNIVSESKIAHSRGTTVTVEKLFENIRVRRQRLDNAVTGSKELKEIEAYLKGAGIANPKCHISLYHNTTLLWNKASVQTVEQVLYAVLGHSVAKKLGKLGPNKIELDHDENGSCRTVELYLPIKPVDMRTMSYTSNKMAMIFCNQKRVYIREFEKLIHRYVVANVERPQPADQRRFPVSIILIKVPSREVDFNLDMDKTKVLLVHKDKIRDAIENALINFYGIDLRSSTEEAQSHVDDIHSNNNQSSGMLSTDIVSDKNLAVTKHQSNVETPKDRTSPERQIHASSVTPVLNTSSVSCTSRQSSIHEFLQNIPSTSSAFTNSPAKLTNLEPVTVSFPVSKPNVDGKFATNETNDLKLKKPRHRIVANFEISVNSQESPSESQEESDTSKLNTVVEKRDEDVGKYLDWVEGRMKDKFGGIVESVVPVSRPQIPNQQESERFRSALLAGSSKSNSISSDTRSQPRLASFSQFNSLEPPPKRLKNEILGSKSNIVPPPIIPCGMLRMSGQVTVDSSTRWAAPTVFSQAASNSVVGVRIPLTPTLAKPSVDIPVSHHSFANCKESRLPETLVLWEQQERPHYKQQFSIPSQNETKNNVHFSLTGSKESIIFSKQLTPQLHKEIGGTFCEQLYFAQTYDSIGVFSPLNMIKFFPDESRDCYTSGSSASPETGPICLSLEDVSRMFQQFVTCSSISQTEVAEKIFHVISKLPLLTKSVSKE